MKNKNSPPKAPPKKNYSSLGLVFALLYAGISLVLLATILFGDIDWLVSRQDRLPLIRDILLVVTAIFAVPVALWRGFIAEKQSASAGSREH